MKGIIIDTNKLKELRNELEKELLNGSPRAADALGSHQLESIAYQEEMKEKAHPTTNRVIAKMIADSEKRTRDLISVNIQTTKELLFELTGQIKKLQEKSREELLKEEYSRGIAENQNNKTVKATGSDDGFKEYKGLSNSPLKAKAN